MKLVATIDNGRADIYRTNALDVTAPSGLRASRPIVFEPIAGGWRGSATIDGSAEDRERDVALHLRALVEVSRANPGWRIRIEIEPDGGVLQLQAGSFGEEAEEVAALLRWTTTPPPVLDGAHSKLYVSVRLPEDAHRHFLDLVVRQLPDAWPAPVTDASLGAIALGFELTGDASQTAQLISALRYAWLIEGSAAQCLVELEGAPPVVRRIDGLRGWTELERELRAVQLEAASAISEPAATACEAPAIEVARVTKIPMLGTGTLSWIDDAGRILGLGADGVIRDLPERIEATIERPETGRATYWRRRDGSSCLRWPGSLVEIPHEPDVEREVRGSTRQGMLLTERRGADTRLRLLSRTGLRDGPLFRNLKALVLSDRDNYAMVISDAGGSSSLATIDLANWGWDRGVPWPASAEVTDLAALGTHQLAAVANVDGAGQLYIIAAYTGELEHTVYLPCTDSQIVHNAGASVWLTGASPRRRTSRHDLLRVDLAPSIATTLLTSGINADDCGALYAARRDADWILAYERRGLFVMDNSIEALVALDTDEEITAICTGPLLAVFTTGPRGSKLLLGDQQLAVISLPSPAYAPCLVADLGETGVRTD